VQRYPLEWIVALREMEKLNAELLFPGHGAPVIGKDRVKQLLSDTAAFLEDVCSQTMTAMNQGMRLADIVKGITIPEHLLEKPYLRPVYDDPRFIVHNLWRHYAGWWYVYLSIYLFLEVTFCIVKGTKIQLICESATTMRLQKRSFSLQAVRSHSHTVPVTLHTRETWTQPSS